MIHSLCKEEIKVVHKCDIKDRKIRQFTPTEIQTQDQVTYFSCEKAPKIETL